MSTLTNFMDDQGRITKWPKKQALKIEVIKYIAEKFEAGRYYTEKEVNEIISSWHTYGDYFMLRRGMVDCRLMARTKDGAQYWKIDEPS
ncbi:MAG TPA: transcriptional regulator [Clostridiales bacterium UBA8960]|jgi:hypothetical protein|nr:transcriptional regulator [Clostridiales bacterium UBA8960]